MQLIAFLKVPSWDRYFRWEHNTCPELGSAVQLLDNQASVILMTYRGRFLFLS